MLVSSVSLTDSKTVFNTRTKSSEPSNSISNTPNNLITEKQSKLFDSINEWKFFCHAQIEKGNFDIIV